MAPRKEMNRTSGVARRKAPNASYNNSPFKGSDPFSQIASFAWRLPGAIASGRTLSGRKVTGEEVSGIAAMAALGAAGIYAGTRGVRGTRPASGPNAGRSGATKNPPVLRGAGPQEFPLFDQFYGGVPPVKPTARAAGIYAGTKGVRGTRPASGPNAGRSGATRSSVATRSAAVTRAGRTGVGKIGPSIKPKRETSDWAYDPEAGEMRFEPTHFDTPYDEVYSKAAAIYSKRTGKDNPGVFRVISGPLVNTRYRGFTETVNIPDAYEDPYTGQRSGVDFDFITGAMKKTLDWKAARPRKTTAATTRKVVRKNK